MNKQVTREALDILRNDRRLDDDFDGILRTDDQPFDSELSWTVDVLTKHIERRNDRRLRRARELILDVAYRPRRRWWEFW